MFSDLVLILDAADLLDEQRKHSNRSTLLTYLLNQYKVITMTVAITITAMTDTRIPPIVVGPNFPDEGAM